ncbi:MAG: phage terminase large subunit-like protein [Alteromonadaceae bacterium]|jgi:phage terminase large subunit-like protein
MSPEQLRTLQKLSRLFEDGCAGPSQIKQLSELLTTINQSRDIHEHFEKSTILQNNSFKV